MTLDDLACAAGMVVGIGSIYWACFGDEYDDRGERSFDRAREVGWWRHSPVPMRRRDRIGGVLMGLVLVGLGVWFLVA